MGPSLEGHKNLNIEHKQTVEKKHEYKFIGSGKKRKGHSLYGLDPNTLVVYKIEIIVKKAFDISKKKEAGKLSATINPTHFFLYSLNRENAVRKINKKFNLNLE